LYKDIYDNEAVGNSEMIQLKCDTTSQNKPPHLTWLTGVADADDAPAAAGLLYKDPKIV